MILHDPQTREEWLQCRSRGIGGSDAAAAIGLNKYTSNVELWRIKTHREQAADISDEPAVKYGKEAEAHIRALFALDYPNFIVDYHEYRMYANDNEHWLYATLDGELTDKKTGKQGILEIKTTTIQNSSQWNEWKDRIPESYYIQTLHQMLATGRDFVILRAYIRHYDKDGKLTATVKDYPILREEVKDDMEYLFEREKNFWEYVQSGKEPPLILPMI